MRAFRRRAVGRPVYRVQQQCATMRRLTQGFLMKSCECFLLSFGCTTKCMRISQACHKKRTKHRIVPEVESSSCCVNIFMRYSFREWEQARRLQPQADMILPMIAASGVYGMNRKQLGHAVDLDRDVLDQVLAGLVSFGLLTVTTGLGGPVYRSTSPISRLTSPTKNIVPSA